jgi:hypothetical protein
MIDGAVTNALDFGAVGDGVADDTQALIDAYASAAATTKSLYIPKGTYKFTSQLVWDGGSVNVFGVQESTTLVKTGNFDGIYIGSSGGSAVYSGFRLIGDVSNNGGKGIVLRNVSYATLEKLFIFRHGGDGIYLDDTTGGLGMYFNNFNDILITTNGGNGIAIDSTGNTNTLGACNSNYFNNVAITANTGIGFYQFGQAVGASGYHVGAISCEQNVGGGASLNGISSTLNFYLESNGNFDLKLDTTSVRNYITLRASTLNPQNFGTNNYINAIAFVNAIIAPNINGGAQAANVAGRPLGVSAGDGGAGATAVRGGDLSVASGNANGTTGDASGGDIYFYAGAGVNNGDGGLIYMDPFNQSVFTFGSFSGSNTSTLVKFGSPTRVPLFAPLTSTQIAALTPLAGMVAYNGTTNKLQCYNGSGWQDLF